MTTGAAVVRIHGYVCHASGAARGRSYRAGAGAAWTLAKARGLDDTVETEVECRRAGASRIGHRKTYAYERLVGIDFATPALFHKAFPTQECRLPQIRVAPLLAVCTCQTQPER